MTRRTFGLLWSATFGAAVSPSLLSRVSGDQTVDASGSGIPAAALKTASSGPPEEDDELRSELLFDIVFARGTASNLGSPANRVVVPVAGGSFEGPGLKGILVAPSGDWMSVRPDKSSILDLRFLLQTDDGEKIFMPSRGIAFTQPGGALFARILPMFETGATKYLWLNNVVAVGVYKPTPGKVTYRIYKIL